MCLGTPPVGYLRLENRLGARNRPICQVDQSQVRLNCQVGTNLVPKTAQVAVVKTRHKGWGLLDIDCWGWAPSKAIFFGRLSAKVKKWSVHVQALVLRPSSNVKTSVICTLFTYESGTMTDTEDEEHFFVRVNFKKSWVDYKSTELSEIDGLLEDDVIIPTDVIVNNSKGQIIGAACKFCHNIKHAPFVFGFDFQ